MAIQNERIRQKFWEMGLSLSQLSALTNIPKSTLHKYINGERENIPIKSIESIATALGLSPIFIVGWENKQGAVANGKWIFVGTDYNDMHIYKCSNCETKRYGSPLFCSHCGSKNGQMINEEGETNV